MRERSLEVAYLAKKLAQPYAEGYDASLSSVSGGSVAPARTSWVKSDPTGDTATSPLHGAMRYKVRLAAHRCQKALDELELARGDLLELFLQSDPQDPHSARNRRAANA